MEFSSRKTPKSQHTAGLRHNPYASGGKIFFSKFRNSERNAINLHVTPPRKPFNNFSKSGETSNVKSNSRARNILRNSQIQNSPKENVKENKFSPVKGNNFNSKPFKRAFQSLNTQSDPFNIFSDEEGDDELLSNKYTKKRENDIDKDKENNNNNNASNIKTTKVSPRVYSPNRSMKRKPVSLFRSKIVHDVSPERITQVSGADSDIIPEKFFFTSGCLEKENKPAKNEEMLPHMIGFPNFGNTCYLNAVLQTLVGLPSLINDLSSTIQTLNVSETSLSHSLWNVVVARRKSDLSAIKNSLRNMKENVEKIDGSFSGCKMQDANEFLTQVLDTIKDEVINGRCLAPKEDILNCFDGTPEKLPNLIDPSFFNTSDNIQTENLCKKSIFSTPSSSPSNVCVGSQELKLRLEEDPGSPLHLTENVTPIKAISSLTDNNRNEIKEGGRNFVNPVMNNFEFELFESFRCLGCGETEGKRQKHIALYVDLVEDNQSIQEAVESYMKEDQRELTCDKCAHKRASFLTSFSQLPRILIVQMKRYKYNTENLELIKVQSKVDINLWLHLDKLSSKNISLPSEFVKKPLRYDRKDSKLSTLSVRNLESELNICFAANSTTKNEINKNTNANEDQQLEEVLKKSFEEFGGEETEKCEKSEQEKEEEELQTAIKLSLQDLGMSFAEHYHNQTENIEVCDDDTTALEVSDNDTTAVGKNSYRLISVISHFGLTTTTGHYVSDILKCDEAKWYHYDDEIVTSLSESVIGGEGRQKNGYIFFYIHKNIYNDIREMKT